MSVLFGSTEGYDFDWQPSQSKPQVHFSNLDALWRCGEFFKFRCVDKVFSSPPTAIHVGRAVDIAANLNLDNKIKHDALLPLEQLLDVARDATRQSFDRDGVTPTATESEDPVTLCDEAVDKAVRMTRAHAVTLAPTLKPAAVQQSWSFDHPRLRFAVVGTRDLDETDATIRDLKTSKRSPQKTAAWTSDQGTLYAMSRWILDKLQTPIRFAIDTIVETPIRHDIKIVQLTSERTIEDFQVMTNRLENAARVIQSGVFTPARQTDWWCSETYCPYTSRCRYFRRPVSVAVSEGQ